MSDDFLANERRRLHQLSVLEHSLKGSGGSWENEKFRDSVREEIDSLTLTDEEEKRREEAHQEEMKIFALRRKEREEKEKEAKRLLSKIVEYAKTLQPYQEEFTTPYGGEVKVSYITEDISVIEKRNETTPKGRECSSEKIIGDVEISDVENKYSLQDIIERIEADIASYYEED